MSIDENILNESIEKHSPPTLRIYGWSTPTITLGRNQNKDGINSEFCISNNIDIIKRVTGGRALLHDQEITYSFVCPVEFLKNGSSVMTSYKEISDALIMGFKEIGIELSYPEYKKVFPDNGYCMAVSTGSDLSYKGKKLIGSAQFRKQGYILQHGSILMDLDIELLNKIFKNVEITNDVTTIKEINPSLLNRDTICNAIKKGFESKFRLEF